MEIFLRRGDETLVLCVARQGEALQVELPGGRSERIDAAAGRDGVLVIRIQGEGIPGRTFTAAVAETARGIEVSFAGRQYVFERGETGAAPPGGLSASVGDLTAPMVGVVAEILATEGEEVAAYQTLLVIEAMKVMAPVEAPFAGRVTRLHVARGDRVNHGALLATIERTPEESV